MSVQMNTMEKLIKNPHLMLLFVTYLLIVVSMFPLLVKTWETPAFPVIIVLIVLLSSAFFAGWFALVRSAVLSEPPKKHGETFFASIPGYMFSILFFIVLICLVTGGLEFVAGRIYPIPEEVIKQVIANISASDSLNNILQTCPKEIIENIIKRNLVIYGGTLVYLFFTFYSIPSLYFNNSKNPLVALKNGLLAVFKKPLQAFKFFILILSLHVAIIFIEAITIQNQAASFLALVLRISFISYAVMLLFSLYEANFTDNGNNGGDCLGENGVCN